MTLILTMVLTLELRLKCVQQHGLTIRKASVHVAWRQTHKLMRECARRPISLPVQGFCTSQFACARCVRVALHIQCCSREGRPGAQVCTGKSLEERVILQMQSLLQVHLFSSASPQSRIDFLHTLSVQFSSRHAGPAAHPMLPAPHNFQHAPFGELLLMRRCVPFSLLSSCW